MRAAFVGVMTLITLGLAGILPVVAKAAKPLPTVEGTYLGLSMGALREARLTNLPQGTVLRAGAVTVTEPQVAAAITQARPDMHASLNKNQFYLLEQVAIKTLLLVEARAWAKDTRWTGKADDDQALINAYFTSITDKVTVTDAELRAGYEDKKAMMGGATFTAVAKELRTYLLNEKRDEAVDRHVRTLSARLPVEVDAIWVAAQAKTALDNPVDQARRSGKPAVIEFGAEGCQTCDMMAPILKSVRETYGRQCTVLITNVRQEPIFAARYGIESIPVQVFFNKDGREVYRHTGFFAKAEILAQLTKLGVK